MAGQRRAAARGLEVRPVRLASFPAAHELVQAAVARVGNARAHPAVFVHRGRKFRVDVSSFGRVFVFSLAGAPIGASSFGAAWAE